MIDAAGGMLVVMLRFLALAATTGILGAWVFGRLVVDRLIGDLGDRHRPSLHRFSVRVAIGCSAVLMLSTAARLFAQAAAFTEPGDPLWPSVLSVLQTRWGWALVAQALTATIVGVTLLFGRHGETWPRLSEAGVAALAVLPAYLGHAGAAGEWRAISVLVDVTHVAAAGSWVGALGLLTATALRGRGTADGRALSAALIVAFHPVAMVAASTVFVTGLVTAWLRMGAPVGIASSSYSGLFVAKLLLVGVVGAIGAGHAKLARRRQQSVDAASTGRTLLAETMLAVLVLAITAVLTGTEPIA
ncbi:MAG: CopD family protein [Gemmatimonadota bacterium]